MPSFCAQRERNGRSMARCFEQQDAMTNGTDRLVGSKERDREILKHIAF
jgi:hypothetical protein